MYINIRRLLSGGMDRMVWLWDIATGLRVRISSALENNVCQYVYMYVCIHAYMYVLYILLFYKGARLFWSRGFRLLSGRTSRW
jgi:hypothetical protein